MANTVQATKRAQQSKQRAVHNSSQRSRLRTSVKNLRKNQSADTEAFRTTATIIDKSVTKGLIHPNKAARLKSRLNRFLRGLNQPK